MKESFKFHHVGYAVKSIEKTLPFFNDLGYVSSNIYVDKIQNVRVCLLNNDQEVLIELVEGLDELNSPVCGFLNKIGITPYHICYTVDDIDQAILKMRDRKYTLLFNPVPAAAFSSRKICYMFNHNIGLIELLENEISSI